MNKKSTEAYIALFEFINTNIVELNPSSFMMDFERASRRAISSVYPECVISGCYFHFKQAVRKRASQISVFF